MEEEFESLLALMDPIHPDAKIGENVKIGHGTIIEEDCVIGNNVFIGHYVLLRKGTIVGNDTKISHFATTEPGARIGNNVNMGVYCHVTKDAVLQDWVFFGFRSTTLNTKKIAYGRNFPVTLEPPVIEYGARIGGCVIIMPGVTIGREALIGAGALITKDCDPYGIYVGRPAKKMGEVREEERL